MKRISRDPSKFDLLHAVDRLVRAKGLNIREPTNTQAIFDELRNQFARTQPDDIFFHGHRVETLFGYVAASLGRCRLIKREDAGEVFSSVDGLRIPDYRIATTDGRQLMVEVKNCHTGDPQEPFEIKKEYLHGLRAYATSFGCGLFFAIYWSRAKQWTLLSAEDLNDGPSRSTITMIEALRRSRMHVLGDRLIGTVPVLMLRLIGSADSGHADAADGHYLFRTAEAQLFCGKDLIREATEQQIAWFLMNNGRWDVSESPAEFDGPRLSAVSFLVTPSERNNPEQDFEIVGTLSELVSRQFDDVTTRDGEITSISPQAEPAAFGISIPEDFKGAALRLWMFDILPPELPLPNREEPDDENIRPSI